MEKNGPLIRKLFTNEICGDLFSIEFSHWLGALTWPSVGTKREKKLIAKAQLLLRHGARSAS